MSFHVMLSVLPFVLLLTFSLSEPKSDGFSINLIHRDSLISSLHNSTAGNSSLINRVLQRSKRRAEYLDSRSLASGTVTADMITYTGEFLMKLSIGTPPSEVIGILDTSSALSWTQCAPCVHCFPQKQPLFIPKKSWTYKVLQGNSKPCKLLGGKPSILGDNTCRYSLFYLRKYHSTGVFTSDTLTMKTTSGTPTSQPNFIFGCGFDNYAQFKGEEAAGVFGLGAGPGSFITQTNSLIGGKFSYCLGYNAHNYPQTSEMHFGSRAAVTGASVVTTSMHIYKNSYAIRLKGISVGATKMVVTTGLSNSYSSKIFGFFNHRMVVDSGSTLSYIPKKFLYFLDEEMRKQMKLEVVDDPNLYPGLCYRTSDGIVRGPIVTLHFVGANIRLYPINSFLKVSKDVHCLAFESEYGPGVSILGNLAQMNFLVGFDLKRKIVSFKPTDCSKQN